MNLSKQLFLDITLLRNKPGWIIENDIAFRGYFFIDETLYKERDAIRVIAKLSSKNKVVQFLQEANGSYAIASNASETFIAVDKARSIPLVYKRNKASIVVSDFAEELGLTEKAINADAELKLSASVVGNRTLDKNIWQLKTGQFAYITSSKEANAEYYHHHYSQPKKQNLNKNPLMAEFDKISESTFSRLLRSISPDSQIVIPLSGGYDSRYILTALKKQGAKNILCFTYGREDSYEVSTAREITSALNIDWEYIKYDQKEWEWYAKSSDVAEYHKKCANQMTTPHCQEYIALNNMLKRGIIDKNSVFIPGFCGDLLGGSYIPLFAKSKAWLTVFSLLSFKKIIYADYFYLSNKVTTQEKKLILKSIEKEVATMGQYNDTSVESRIDMHDRWITEEKASKYVVNAVRLYEHFGMEWRLPLWDDQLMDFWYSIPYTLKQNDKLYDQYLFEYHFQPNNIAIKKPTKIGKTVLTQLLNIILPPVFLSALKAPYHKALKKSRNLNDFSILYDLTYTDLKEKGYNPSRTTNIIQILAYKASLKMEQ